MAKNKDEFDLDDFNLDDFSVDSGFQDPADVKDDRSPVTKVAAGALNSALDSAKSPGYYGQILKKALPTSYGEAFDVIDTVGSEGVGLYNEVVRDLKPTISVMKKAAKTLKPRLEPILPKKLSEKLDKFLASDADPKQVAIDAQQAQIDASLLEVFKSQAESQQQKDATETIQKAVDNKRAQANLDQMQDVRTSLHRLVSFQDGVQMAYLKKSLELKYRHYFAAKDLLDITKASTTESIQLLRTINKNTALPDFVKMRTDEALKEQFRNKLTGSIQGYVSDRTAPFIREILGNLRTRVKEKTRSFADAVGNAAMGAETMDDGLKMAEEFGMSKETMAGQLVGGGAMGGLADWLGKKLKPIVNKNKHITGGGYALQRGLNSFPDMVRDWAKSYTESYGMKGNLIDFAKSLVGKEQTSFNIAEEKFEDIKAVAYWTNQDSKTLQEIIPGLLSRIHQSTEGIRTGELPDPLRFDFKSNGFISEKSYKQKIKESIVSKYNLDDYDYRTKHFLELIDPDEKLPTEVRDSLRIKLLQEVSRKQSFNIKDFNTPEAYSKMFDEETAELVANKFSNLVKVNQDGKTDITDTDSQKNYLVLSNAYRAMRERQEKAIETANIAGSLGNRDLLRSMGVVTHKDNKDVYNNNYVLDVYKNYLKNGRNYENTVRETSLDGVSNDEFVGPRRPTGGGMGSVMYRTTPTPVDAEIIKTAMPKVQEEREVVKTKRFVSPYGPKHLMQDENVSVPWRSRFEESDQSEDDSTNRIVEAIGVNSSKIAAESMDLKLGEILEAVLTMDCGGRPTDGKSKGRIRKALGAGFRGAKSATTKYLKMLWAAQKKIITTPFKLAKKLGSKSMDLWKKYRQSVKDRIQDVYIMGFAEPKLTAAKMREGHYVDAETGDPITKIGDIKGAVRDLITGEIVITKAEFDSGLYNNAWKKLTNKSKSWVLDKVGKTSKWIKDLALKPFKLMRAGLTNIKEALFTPKDVYVPGESTPRLLGLLMLRGKYFSSKSGKPVRKIGDIDSDVKDENGKVVLTLEEFAKGVVDQEGNPILTRTQKVMNLITSGFKAAKWVGGKALDAAKYAKDKAVAGAKWAKDKVVGLGSKVKGVFSGVKLPGFSANIGKESHQVEQINVLKKIHNMLRAHFGIDGDDLPMTEMPSTSDVVGGLKSKIKGLGKRSAARARLARMKLRGKGNGLSSKFRLAARKKLLQSKARKLWDKRPKYKTWKDKLKDTIASGRKNSWREIFEARKNKNKDKVGAKIGTMVKEKSGVSGAILSAVLGMYGLFKTAVGKLGDIIGGLGSMRKILTAISAGKAVSDTLGGVDLPDGGMGNGKSKPNSKKGLASKAWGGIKKGGKWLAGGLFSAGGWALRGAGVILSGAASFVSAPVVLTGLAIAGVATAGYYTYRYFKDKLKPLQKVRFTQYGLPTDDTDFNVQVGEMERLLTNAVEWDGKKAVNIKMGQNLETILTMFGINISDGDSVKRFTGWFQSRFKPVYLTHLTLLKKFAGNAPLETIDETLPKQFKSEFANSTKYAENDPLNPYRYEQHPMFGKKLITGVEQINIAIQEVDDAFAKYKGKSEDQVVAADQKTLDRYKHSRNPALDPALNKVRNMGVTDTKISDPLAAAGAARLSGMNSAKVEPANYVLDPSKAESTAITTPKVKDRVRSMPVAYGGNVSDFIKARQEGNGGEGTYASIPQPSGAGYQALIGTLESAASATGIHPSLLAAIANAESSFNPNAKASTSSAMGLFQFMPDTWRRSMAKFGDKYGIPPNATPMDPVASSLLAGELTRDNALIVEKKAGVPVGPAEAYIAHFFGAGAASSFLKADPNANAVSEFPTQASQNKPIFFNKDGSGRTVNEVYNVLANKVEKGNFGVNNGISLLANEQVKPQTTRDLASKSPAVDANKQQVQEEQSKKQKVATSIAPINYATFATGASPFQKQVTREIQPTVMDSRVAAMRTAEANAGGQPKVNLAREINQTSMATNERKRREKEIQLSANYEAMTQIMTESQNILKDQLAVQIDIRDGINRMVGGFEKLVGGMMGQPEQAVSSIPKMKPNHPLDLGRKGTL